MFRTGEGEVVSIPSPTNGLPWRVSGHFVADVGIGHIVKLVVSRTLRLMGIPARYELAAYDIESNEVEAGR
jgi:hypothetical protein